MLESPGIAERPVGAEGVAATAVEVTVLDAADADEFWRNATT
jgi:hypothetical protein